MGVLRLSCLDRNYPFFDVIGDIGEYGFPCICPNKGMPQDASRETLQLFTEEDGAAQKYIVKWGTTQDVKDYDWNQEIIKGRALTWERHWWRSWRRDGKHWIMDWSGIDRIPQELVHKILRAKDTIAPDVQMLLDYIKAAAKQLGPHNVRLVCWFD